MLTEIPSPIKSSKPNASEPSSNALQLVSKSSESSWMYERICCNASFLKNKQIEKLAVGKEQLTKNPMFTVLRLLNDSQRRPIVIKTIISYSVWAPPVYSVSLPPKVICWILAQALGPILRRITVRITDHESAHQSGVNVTLSMVRYKIHRQLCLLWISPLACYTS